MLLFNLESKYEHKLLIILVVGHFKGLVYMKLAEVFVLVPINQTKAERRQELFGDKTEWLVWPEVF